jgi:hypothetical protein
MEPISLVTIAATLIATKAVEKVGEKLGEKGFSAGGKLLSVLQRKSPDTAKRLAAANPEVIDAEIIAEVKRVAAADPEVKAAIDEGITAIESEALALGGLTKLAEKIGVVNLGTVQNQTNNITI